MIGVSTRIAAALKALIAVMAFAAASAHGAVLTISVLDSRSQPVPDAVITVTSLGAPPAQSTAPPPAVMDQVAKAFVPAVLVVHTGTAVIFPNSDSVAHQVYSFSPTKRFELGLYRGHPYDPVVFDRPGLVVLGCNIHDNMVGYIFVTDAPYFGKSDDKGTWRSDALPAAEYEVAVWSARLTGKMDATRTRVKLDGESHAVQVRLPEALRAAVTQERNARGRY
jgi:plastocyanin